jgi:adenosylhomocysteine nucleosidase
VVTGLASEAAVVSRICAGTDVKVVCAASNGAEAKRLAKQLVDDGVEGLMSFGIAGALDPALQSGELLIADEVLLDEVGNSELFHCDRTWLDRLHAALNQTQVPYRGGLLVGSHVLWRKVSDKEAIHEITGAAAVDMESGAVAAVAAEAGLPFLAVRAVADRAVDSLPAFVETAVKPDGRPAVGRVLAALARRPGDIPATLRLARQTARALAALRRLDAVKAALFGGFG